jgi:hypothetical protein
MLTPRDLDAAVWRLGRDRGFLAPGIVVVGLMMALMMLAIPDFWWLRKLGLVPVMLCIAVAAAATWNGGRRSVRALLRPGLSGPFCAHWWFDLARGGVTVFCWAWLALVAAAVVGVAFPQLQALPAADHVWRAGRDAISISIWFSNTTFAVGYLISLLRRQPRAGRAFECGLMFFCCIGGMGLTMLGANQWPAPRLWPEGVLAAASFGIGVTLCTVATPLLLLRYYGTSAPGSDSPAPPPTDDGSTGPISRWPNPSPAPANASGPRPPSRASVIFAPSAARAARGP